LRWNAEVEVVQQREHIPIVRVCDYGVKKSSKNEHLRATSTKRKLKSQAKQATYALNIQQHLKLVFPHRSSVPTTTRLL
jgi:hypothetical protein